MSSSRPARKRCSWSAARMRSPRHSPAATAWRMRARLSPGTTRSHSHECCSTRPLTVMGAAIGGGLLRAGAEPCHWSANETAVPHRSVRRACALACLGRQQPSLPANDAAGFTSPRVRPGPRFAWPAVQFPAHVLAGSSGRRSRLGSRGTGMAMTARTGSTGTSRDGGVTSGSRRPRRSAIASGQRLTGRCAITTTGRFERAPNHRGVLLLRNDSHK